MIRQEKNRSKYDPGASKNMEFVNQGLYDGYKRWVNAFSEESSLFNDCVISINDVLSTHFSIVDYFLEKGESEKGFSAIGPIDKELLSSAVARQINGNSGYPKWETEYEKCATLFYGLIKNHPFYDCNKGTALLTAIYYLAKLNRAPTARHKELEIITRIVASNEIRARKAFKPYSKFEDGEIRFLAQYFQRNTHPIDTKHYVITYSELNKLLGNFGYSLNNPRGNLIDITRIENQSSLFGLPIKRERHTGVGAIEFLGWTREVSKKAIRLLREYTGLTAKDGLASQIAYKRYPPLSSLLNKYGGVLQHLARK